MRELLALARNVSTEIGSDVRPPRMVVGDVLDLHAQLLSDENMRWLKQLPKPCGILACYDVRGREVGGAQAGHGEVRRAGEDDTHALTQESAVVRRVEVLHARMGAPHDTLEIQYGGEAKLYLPVDRSILSPTFSLAQLADPQFAHGLAGVRGGSQRQRRVQVRPLLPSPRFRDS